MKYLFIGDVHAKSSDLEDCWYLQELIKTIAEKEGVDRIVYLGDQYHTHSILHIEVINFWKKAFEAMVNDFDIVALVGNHDQSGNSDIVAHSMIIHENDITVIDKPTVFDNILFMPYMRNDDFIKYSHEYKDISTLICHATFEGAEFENGFYAKDGIDQNKITQQSIISGHIHKPNTLGKVFYPGAPRWQTLSDANIDRFIYVANIDNETVIDLKKYDTGEYCRKIIHKEITKDFSIPVEEIKNSRHQYILDIKGPVDFIEQKKQEFQGIKARIRTFPEYKTNLFIKESEGISRSFYKYLENFTPKNGTSLEVLEQIAKERLNV